MNWSVVGAVSEIIGAVAVVVSLVYLATQIRQATKIARANTRNAIAESAQSLAQDIIDGQGMAEIFIKHLNGEQLDAVESLRLQGRCYRDLRHWENIFYQVREGLITEEEWFGFRKNLGALMGVPIYQEYWRHEAELYSDAFRREIETIISDLPDLKERVRFADRFNEEQEAQDYDEEFYDELLLEDEDDFLEEETSDGDESEGENSEASTEVVAPPIEADASVEAEASVEAQA